MQAAMRGLPRSRCAALRIHNSHEFPNQVSPSVSDDERRIVHLALLRLCKLIASSVSWHLGRHPMLGKIIPALVGVALGLSASALVSGGSAVASRHPSVVGTCASDD